MPNHITSILTAPAHVLAALKGAESAVDFNTLIPMPEGLHKAISDGYADFVHLVFGLVDLSPPPMPDGPSRLFSPGGMAAATAQLKLSNVIRSIKGGGLAKCTDEQFENVMLMMRNQRQHGATTWYEWALEKWGTKWNAYSIEEREGCLKFETAWSPPHPVIEFLAKQFPGEKILHQWADEDIGHNCGTRTYEEGRCLTMEPPDAVDFALTITGRDRKNYRPNPSTGKWEYYETEE